MATSLCIINQPLNTVSETRANSIRSRFIEYGCSERFELVDIIDGTHVTLRCKACGNYFVRETSFLKPRNKGKTNIECRNCGMHANGTVGATAKSENKRGMSDDVLVAFYVKGNSASMTAAHFGVNLRRVTRAINAAGVNRAEQKKPIPDEYVHELAGDEYLDEVLVCNECGREFTRHEYAINSGRKSDITNWTPAYCCCGCSMKAIRRGGRARRRKRERSLTYKPIPLTKLIERDCGICQLCGEPVDITDGWYDANGGFHIGRDYPTVDHIIPLSKGGDNTWDNVQLAHHRCNSGKRDRVD